MDNLKSLMQGFVPRRTFRGSCTTVEVDGMFVRVSDDEDEVQWVRVDEPDGSVSFRIPAEDLLQDPAVVRSARVSTGRDSVAVDEKAAGLVRFLYRDRHATPLEGGVHFRLRITTPVSYAQPLFRLFASYNEFSGRYSVLDGDYYRPGNLPEDCRREFEIAEHEAQGLYHELIQREVATEMARYAHLYRFFTKFYMTISLRHLLEFLTLGNVPERNSLWSRHELTEYGEIRGLMHQIVEHWTPWALDAYKANPRQLDFSWARELGSIGDPMSWKVAEKATVLDWGEIRLISSYGSDAMMLSLLDDFPDPRQAFGHGGMTFVIKLPIHVFRQWVRHRDGSWCEPTVDFDKVVFARDFFVPERFRRQVGKVGAYTYSGMGDGANNQIRVLFAKHLDRCIARYKRLKLLGLPAQQACMILPYRFYMPAVWTPSVRSLLNFFSLRCDGHAQQETRAYANEVWKMFATRFPMTARVFAKHLHYGDSALITPFAE